MGWEVRDEAGGARLVRADRAWPWPRDRADLRAAAGGRGRAGAARGPPGLAGARDAGGGARAALRLDRAPGNRRRGRPVSVRRPRLDARGRGRAGRGLGPDPGPAQPRRDLPHRRGRRRRRRGDPRPTRRRCDARRLQGLGGRGRASSRRPGPQPRRLAGRGEGPGRLDLRGRRRGQARLRRGGLVRAGGAGARLGGGGDQAPGRHGLRRARLDSASRGESTR